MSSNVSGGEARKGLGDRARVFKKTVIVIYNNKLTHISRVRDALASAQENQKEYSDKRNRGNLNVSIEGDLVLLDTKNLTLKVASSVESNKLNHRFIRLFVVLVRHGAACTIDHPKSMATLPTFYVGRCKRYHDPQGYSPHREEDLGESSPL
ncbi:Pol protein [Phytophthora palmivora]|uniref:Pol protein n=1 Tax=Phytophthora palmivora TaxID=4796 RepID=A0A2P4YG07_9STRA|nr:Pol protein [Phytophthora palmivora]